MAWENCINPEILQLFLEIKLMISSIPMPQAEYYCNKKNLMGIFWFLDKILLYSIDSESFSIYPLTLQSAKERFIYKSEMKDGYLERIADSIVLN
ncbi:unnamed protein product [Blepharisma stoltei]|uniref:Uncharacterized protein n=1 Tax=Blepharisma stoltei TaxID=1481888 RepID=A0AAU9J213_9CILI|nr:unnamed protein product [Blepharisma stoltei]